MLRTVVARTFAVLLVAAAWSPRPVRADAVVGTGTASSCTDAALDAALAGGGNVTFNCGASHPTYGAVLPPAAPSIVGRIDEMNIVELKGNTHPLARPEYDQGAVPDSFPMEHMLLLLRRSPEREVAFERLIEELQDSHAPNYHRWLTPRQVGDEFGPSPQNIAAITAWLQSHGFQINVVYPNGLLLDITGTAGQLRDAFHTEIHKYDVEGVAHIANATDPMIPAALASVVTGFVSLNDFRPTPLVHNITSVKKDQATGKWQPVGPQPEFNFLCTESGCVTFYDVGPLDFATIYDVRPLWTAASPITGQDQTIAVVASTDINPADWSAFRSAFGLGSFAGSLTQIHPPPPSGANNYNCSDPGTVSDSEIEAAIDAEWAGAAAPDAAIELASCAGTGTSGLAIAAANLVSSDNPPPIISVSWGACEAALGNSGNAFVNSLWQQAAAEGISVIVAAGDTGSSAPCAQDRTKPTTVGAGVNGFASTPYNLAVGGTDFSDHADGTEASYWNTSNAAGGVSAKSYIPEIPWDDSCASSVFYTFSGFSPSENLATAARFCNNSTVYYNGSPVDMKFFRNVVGGGGGPSAVYSKPAWQSGVTGIANDSMRDVPDVSLFAADGLWRHALLFCMSDPNVSGSEPCNYSDPTDVTANQAGGTSFAAPAFAGIQALINQKTGERQGNPGPFLYGLAAAQYGSIFHDVTRGDNDVVCSARNTSDCYAPSGDAYGVLFSSLTSSRVAYATTVGWDFATGLGSLDVTNLVNAATAFATPTPTFTVSPTLQATPTATPTRPLPTPTFTVAVATPTLKPSPTTTAAAQTFTVTKTADTNDGVCDADCSLREAIIAANANPGADTIIVPAGTYVLTRLGSNEDAADTGDLDITDDLTLTGAGAGLTIIDGNSTDRVFQIIGQISVNISGVTIQNGNLGRNGGGIYNGGISTLNVTNCTFSGNSAKHGGGGISNYYGGNLTVTNTTFSGNTSLGYGGGIENYGTLTVTNCTFSGNSTTGYGGGAIYSNGVTLTVTNTIVANSTSGGNCGGSITDGGHNIDDGTTCGFTGTGCTSTSGSSFCNTNPMLDPAGLANNGGPTQTIALKVGSPAIDAGDESVCSAPPVNNLDQRGYVRPGTGATSCSIGAYGFNSPGAPTATPTDTATPTNTATAQPSGGGGGGCSMTPSADGSVLWLLISAVLVARRRRARD